MPWWARWGSAVVGLYSMVMAINQLVTDGRPESLPSGFALVQDERIVRTLTEPEYWQLARAEVAFTFGSLLWFAYEAVMDRAVAKLSAGGG